MSGELAIRDEAGYLATLTEIRGLIARMTTVGDAKHLADQARTAQVWAERAKLGQEKVNLAVLAKLWAERRAGELLRESRENGDRDPGGRGRIGLRHETQLADLTVTKIQSHRWQKLAAVSAETFAVVCDEALEAGRVNLQEIFRLADRAAREAEAAAEEEALVMLTKASGLRCEITLADLRAFEPGPVDAIITDPPYITEDSLDLYAALRDFAVAHLKPGGVVAFMTWQPLLVAVSAIFDVPDLQYRATCIWLSGAHESTADFKHRVFSRSKPIPVYHRGPWPPDVPMLTTVVNSGRDGEKGQHEWQQTLGGMRQLVRGLSRPGDLVCDPFLGSGTTALAALAETRHFVGCDIDPGAIETTKRRLTLAA